MLSRGPRNGPRVPLPVRSARLLVSAGSHHWWSGVLLVMCSTAGRQHNGHAGSGVAAHTLPDAATNTMLRTVVVGRAPLGLALAEGAGRAIVLNTNDVAARPGHGSASIFAINP